MTTDYIAIAINLGVPLLLILLGLITGSLIEKKHYRSIHERERESGRIPLLSGKTYPEDRPVSEAKMVTGSVVISIDYFKRFLAGLRQIFGGEVKAYVSLVDRGRREAVLRLKEKCPTADLIVNLRIETSSISKGRGKNIGTVEVHAYATALYYS